MDAPPLSWTIDTNALPNGPASFSYDANEAERAVLKSYTAVDNVASFSARVRVTHMSGGRYKAAGRWEAQLIQASVVSLSPVPSHLKEEFSVEYRPSDAEEGEEKTLSPEEDAPEALIQGIIPIGALLSELLAVAIAPYPRNEGESFDWAEPEPEKINPFAALERLRQPKNNGDG